MAPVHPVDAALRRVWETHAPAPVPAGLAAEAAGVVERTAALLPLDRCAWFGTDRLREAGVDLTGVGGWVTVAEGDGRATHFLSGDERPREVCAVGFADDAASGEVRCDRAGRRVRDPEVLRLYAIRRAALADPRVIRRGDTQNAEVLADPAGGWFVVVLAASNDAARTPINGGYRVHVAPGGAVDAVTPLSEGLLAFPAGAERTTVFHQHVATPTPNEGHLYASAAYGIDQLVSTPGHLWRVIEGRLEYLGEVP